MTQIVPISMSSKIFVCMSGYKTNENRTRDPFQEMAVRNSRKQI